LNNILIVGLGNPGSKYEKTRHNIGWMVLKKFVEKHKIELIKKSNIYYSAEMKYAGKNIIICFPTTYMNLSGEAVKKISDKFLIKPQDIIVISDEYNFPLGKVHFKNGGSDGGHNGIANIIEELKSSNFYRLRIGIDRNFGAGELINYVLSEFNENERELLNLALTKGMESLETILKNGPQRAMSMINSGEMWKEKINKDKDKKINKIDLKNNMKGVEMDNFTYYNPTKIIFGKNTIPQIGKELSKYQINNVLVLAGGGSIKKNGSYDEMVKSLKDNNISFIEKWGVQANPILPHALESIELCRDNKVEGIIAIGGGSVIDEAKSIAVGYYANSLWDLYEGKEKVTDSLPIFVILTISATGSEMNPTSVLTNPEQKKKWGFASGLNYPIVSIIDPEKQMTLPWNQTVNGAIDALSHIMENYFVAKNQFVTMGYNESLMNTIIEATNILKDNPMDYNARANLAWSATMALNGYSGIGIKSGEWTCHKIEHSISAFYPNVAHGAGLAIVFPAWIQYMYQYNKNTFDRWAKNVWNANTIEEGIAKMKEQYSKWGAPISLSEIGVNANQIEAIAENVMLIEKFGILKDMNKNDIIEILKIAK